ncbi:hypothetical protein [Pseudoalteromonas rubra]|uniref:Uncharacterized protein n=1 Tax=Pseudoalteromonas rubra TaxID=43658 RepID=A0A0U3IGE1_9GAMM|nr:hypothetical protein [Pseudoalteromonas rubra]ALU46119.1 hypothetical protein AT705_24465 [Pseudoalteromonas rubra]
MKKPKETTSSPAPSSSRFTFPVPLLFRWLLCVGGPLLLLFLGGDLFWLLSAEYGNHLYWLAMIYLFFGTFSTPIQRDTLAQTEQLPRVLLNVWKDIVLWPLRKKSALH